MMKHSGSVAALALALVGGLTGSAQAVTVVDFSFESPSQGGASFTYNPTVVGALFSGGSGVQGNGSAWGFTNAPDGVQTAFLQNNAQIDLGVSGLANGGVYSVTFYDSQRPGYGVLPVTVDFNGASILTTTPGAGWAPVTTATFVATGTTGTLSFITAATSGDNDSGIDLVTVSGGVPEPATWALMLIGFGGLGGVIRGRRSATLTA